MVYSTMCYLQRNKLLVLNKIISEQQITIRVLC